METAADILKSINDELGPIFEQMEWAEDAIRKAQRRHPSQKSAIWHSFNLLRDNTGRMTTETVYAAHAREILDRVARNEDTRPATNVEIVIGLLRTAEISPLTHEGFALLSRCWKAANLPANPELTDSADHYEAIMPGTLNNAEIMTRTKLGDPERRFAPHEIECTGQHHRKPVHCTFTLITDKAQDAA